MRTRLERLLAIEQEIRSGRYPSLESLCRSFSVKSRTIYDDIRILRDRAGMDIKFDRARNGYYIGNPGGKLPSFDLSREEFLLILVGFEILCSSLGAAFRPILNQTIDKIGERLPFGASVIKERAKNIVLSQKISPLNVAIDVSLWFELLQASFDSRLIEIVGVSDQSGKRTAVVIIPNGLFEDSKKWYLFGRTRESGETLVVPLERIVEVRALGIRYQNQDDSDEFYKKFGCLRANGS